MKFFFTYLTLFILSSGYALPFDFELNQDSSKSIDKKYDSLKYSFLPKYEIYGRYFNPFAINSIGVYHIDFGVKWHKKKMRYFKSHFYAFDNPAGNNLQILSFSQMFRLTPKISWIHFELSYGVGLSHNREGYGWYVENWVGLGPIINTEIQFDIGNRTNISIGSFLSGVLNYSFPKQTDFTVPWSLPPNYLDAGVFLTFPPFIYVGFNLYLK